jgi:indole-3-glycerol phosphate synthase
VKVDEHVVAFGRLGCGLGHARANGADAALVIVRLAPERVRMLVEEALKRDLEPLVEVANEDELRVALDAGARMVGVNARDLDTLQMDAVRAARVRASIPDEVIAVHLSGLRRPEDVAVARETPADSTLCASS